MDQAARLWPVCLMQRRKLMAPACQGGGTRQFWRCPSPLVLLTRLQGCRYKGSHVLDGLLMGLGVIALGNATRPARITGTGWFAGVPM